MKLSRLVVASAIFFVRHASAGEQPEQAQQAAQATTQTDDVAPLRLDAILDDEATRERHERTAAAGIAFGLAAMSAGFSVACFAIQPSDSSDRFALQVGGVGFGVIAALGVTLGAITLAVPTDLETMTHEYDSIVRDPRRNDKLAWGESRLAALAEKQRRARVTGAMLSIVLGPLVGVGGITAGALLPMDSDVLRASYIALFSVLSLLDVTVGIARLFSLDPAERLWRTWRIGTGRTVSFHPWIAPTLGGAAAGTTISF